MDRQRHVGAAAEFIDEKLSHGAVTFTLSELTRHTGLSTIAARHQLLRLGPAVARVSPRQEFFVIVSPEQRSIGAPPVYWWLDAYFKWLGRPYYVALQSAAAEHRSMPQAVQVTQIMTDRPRRDLRIGRLRVRFFVKRPFGRTPTEQLSTAYAPLAVSSPEATCLDLIRYAPRIGGIERVSETIEPMLGSLAATRIVQALKAEGDLRAAQRFGYLLDYFKRRDLSAVTHRYLQGKLANIPLDSQASKSGRNVAFNARWAVRIATRRAARK